MHTKISLTLMTVLLLVSLAIPCQAELVGLWKMDETAGNTAKDSTSNHNNGDVEGTAAWEPGVFNNALVMNGSDTYVDLPIGSLMETLEDATLAIWALNDGAAQWSRVIDLGSNTSSYIYVTAADSGNVVRVAITDGTWYEVYGDAMPDGEWQHIAVTLDKTNEQIILYQDGEYISEIESPITLEDLGRTSNNWLGQSQYSADALFTGMVDDFCLYNEVLSQEAILELIEKGSPSPEIALLVGPKNGEIDVALDEILQWQAGIYAGSHDLYFGTSEEDVTQASRTDTRGVLIQQDHMDTSYSFAEQFDLDQTYYWRVDEVNATADHGIFKGTVWHFTAEPTYLNPTPVVVTASSYDVGEDYNCPPENTINGSGLNDGKHSSQASTMWRTMEGEIEGAWIEYEFDNIYQFNQMHIWNFNGENEGFLGVGAKDVVIETSLDGETWTLLSEMQLARATGLGSYTGEDVDMNDVVAQYIRIVIQSQHSFAGGTIVVHKVGLSEIRFDCVPIAARRPTPAVGSTASSLFDEMIWRLGRGAQTSRLYLSTDANLVAAADASVLIDEISGRRYVIADTDAIYGQLYYWRVDEVTGDQVVSGQVWNFNAPDHLVIDDMESYSLTNLIFETWLDGYEIDENGSVIGDDEPYVEQEIAFGGSQSMPMYYDTTDGEQAAWVELAVDSDIFTTGGVAQFSVMFKSDRTNDDGGQFYVEINGTRVYSPASLTTGLWTQLIVDLSDFGNLNSADSLTLGVNGNNLEGVVYIDDVCLYVEAPSLAIPASEQPSDDALEVHYAMEGNLEDSTPNNRDGQSGSGSTLFYEGSLDEGIMDLGDALALDGIEDSYVNVNNAMDDLVASLMDSTYAAWVNLNDDSDQEWTRVFDFGNGTDTYMFLTPRSGANGSPEFGIVSPDSPSAAEQDVAGPASLTAGWHHLAVTIEQGDPNGTLDTLRRWRRHGYR